MKDSSSFPSLPRGQAVGWVPVHGVSMWPVLRAGDAVGFAPLERDPRPGQVVVARVGGRLLVHRVVRQAGANLVLRGDGCTVSDPPVPRAQVLGEVKLVKRDGRILERWDGPVRRSLGNLRALARALRRAR